MMRVAPKRALENEKLPVFLPTNRETGERFAVDWLHRQLVCLVYQGVRRIVEGTAKPRRDRGFVVLGIGKATRETAPAEQHC